MHGRHSAPSPLPALCLARNGPCHFSTPRERWRKRLASRQHCCRLIALIHTHAADNELQGGSGADLTPSSGMLSRQLSSALGDSGGHLGIKCCNVLQAYIPPAALLAHIDVCAAGNECLSRMHAGLAEACWRPVMPARQPQRWCVRASARQKQQCREGLCPSRSPQPPHRCAVRWE